MSEAFHEDDQYSGKFDGKLWLRIAGHTRPYARHLAGMMACGIFLASMESVAPLVTARLIDVARGTLILSDAAPAGTPSGEPLPAAFWALGGTYLGMLALMAGTIWLFIAIAGRIATGVGHDMRRKEFDRLQELSFSYFDSRPVGWLVSRLTSDVNKVSSLIPWFALDCVWGPTLILGIAMAMFSVNAQLALWVLAVVPVMVVVTLFFQQKLLASSRLVRRTNSAITASYNETIAGARTTKALVREDEALREFQRLSESMQAHTLRNALQGAVFRPLVVSLASVGSGLAIWRGGELLGMPSETGGLSVGELIAFMSYAGLLTLPIQDLSMQFTRLQSAQAAAERIQSLLDEVPQIQDTPQVTARVREREGLTYTRGVANEDGLAIDGGRPAIRTVEFRDVSFHYKPGEPVLQGINLIADGPQTIALVGHTGSGKTTIVSLLARFYEPTGGGIYFDGVEYRGRSVRWLQSSIGMVLQTPHLFSGTIRENIRYGRLDATDEQIEDAARAVSAHAFIEALPNAYDAEIGEGGLRLSTGQRQLISLARALLADPQVFILDEATSSVDTETERLVQHAVDTVLRHRIAFVIAHRLSTIRSADQIIVLDRGRILEQGRHEELLAKRGKYRDLYLNQFAVV